MEGSGYGSQLGDLFRSANTAEQQQICVNWLGTLSGEALTEALTLAKTDTLNRALDYCPDLSSTALQAIRKELKERTIFDPLRGSLASSTTEEAPLLLPSRMVPSARKAEQYIGSEVYRPTPPEYPPVQPTALFPTPSKQTAARPTPPEYPPMQPTALFPTPREFVNSPSEFGIRAVPRSQHRKSVTKSKGTAFVPQSTAAKPLFIQPPEQQTSLFPTPQRGASVPKPLFTRGSHSSSQASTPFTGE